MQVIKEEGSVPIKTWTDDIEPQAMQQAKNLARLPFLANNGVALMPDVHMGIGASVGTVIATERAVIPASVGVDLGCGMVALRTSLTASDLPDNLKAIFDQIERDIPLGPGGANQREQDQAVPVPGFFDPLHAVLARHPKLGSPAVMTDKALRQLGSLGSGNHFIEVCLDADQNVWVMLHSGSRGIGNMIGTYFISRAKEQMRRWFIKLPDDDLAYLPEESEDFDDYMEAVDWAQGYALENRRVMMDKVVAGMRRHIPKEFTITQEAIQCHHNYVAREHHFGRDMWITRKGAIRARKGDLGIIPGSMGAKSYIVRGKGDLQAYCSCAHGAGRVMGRKEAKRRFTVADLEAQTQGVMCRKDESVLDEIPSSYKNIDIVMANSADLVEVVAVLKQVLCVKGG